MLGDPACATAAPARRKVPGWLRWALRIGFTVAVTWIIVSQLGVTLEDALALERGIPDAHPLRLSISIGLLLVSYLFAARLWGWMVRDLGERDPGMLGSARVVLTANLGRYLPGKVWQLAGLAVLARRHGITATTGTLAGLLVQGFSLAAAGLWGLPALLRLGGETQRGLWIGVAAAVALVFVLASIPRVTHAAFRLLFRLARRDPYLAPRTDPAFGPRWIGAHGILWGLYGVAFHLLLTGLGFEVAMTTAVFSFAAAYLLGYLALPAPAGIGIREGVLIALLQPDLALAAAPVAILARFWMTAVELIPAGVVALSEALRRPDPAPVAGEAQGGRSETARVGEPSEEEGRG